VRTKQLRVSFGDEIGFEIHWDSDDLICMKWLWRGTSKWDWGRGIVKNLWICDCEVFDGEVKFVTHEWDNYAHKDIFTAEAVNKWIQW
jgi:hypothetical protein